MREIPTEAFIVVGQYSGGKRYDPDEEWEGEWVPNARPRAGTPFFMTYDGAKRHGMRGKLLTDENGKVYGKREKILRATITYEEMP